MNVLIGSRAFDYWFPGVLNLTSKNDWDIISDYNCFHEDDDFRIEHHDSKEYLNFVFSLKFTPWSSSVEIQGKKVHVMNPKGLAAMKRSHLSLDHNWDKHIGFYHKYLKKYFGNSDWELMKEREKITLAKAKQKNPSLLKDNVDFFNDYVDKKYDHDWLHERVAWYDAPLYTRMKKPEKANLAWCEKDLWNSFSHQDKLRCVDEECSVIALERFLIPGVDKYPLVAYRKALKKVCTSLTSGWFRDFAIDNWEELRTMGRVELLQQLTEELR